MMDIPIIYKNKNFIAISKPAGLLVHPTSTGKEKALTDWLVKNYPETKKVGDDPKVRPGIVHRLDKDTSGILIIARTQAFFEYFKKLLQNHKVKKTYLALVQGKITKPLTIDTPIGLRPGTTKYSTRAKKMKMIKEAITAVIPIKVLKYNKESTIVDGLLYFSLIKIHPKTGRTHQIRVHLSSTGHPVVGDKLYGPKKGPLDLEHQFLHAESLEFNLEDGKRVKLEVELPKELQEILKNLQFDYSLNSY